MNPQVEAMVSPFKSSVENLVQMVSDPDKTRDLEQVYNELLDLAKEHGDDMTVFITKTTETDVFNRLSEEMEKAGNSINEGQSASSSTREADLEEVKQSYESIYNQIKDKPHMVETRKTYEEILALAEETGDVTEFQVLIYRKGLVHKTSTMTLYDDAKLEYDLADPNDIHVRKAASGIMNIALESVSTREMSFREMKTRLDLDRERERDSHIFHCVEKLFTRLMDFHNLVIRLRKGELEDHPHYLLDLRYIREDIRKTVLFLEDHFDLDADALFSISRYMRDILAIGFPLDNSKRLWLSHDPGNLAFFRDLLDRVTGETPLEDILVSGPETAFNPAGTPQHYTGASLPEKWLQWVEEHAEKYPGCKYVPAQVKDTFNFSRLFSLERAR